MVSTVAKNYEQLSYGSPSGCMVMGEHQQIISDGVATRQLMSDESGATCLFDRAAGVVYTLPTPVIGMKFRFKQSVTVTSNSAKVITKNPASEFILGMVQVVGGTTETTVSADFNGTTHVACTSNGTTTGGVIGSDFELVAISTTQWMITGVISGSGTVATPAATS